MVRRRIAYIQAALAVIAIVGLTTCTNPGDFMSAVNDEAKSSLKMYLIVSSISPAKNGAEVNPSAPIQIDFDRSLDASGIVADNILIAPSSAPSAFVTWTYDYSDALKRLSVVPSALEGATTYIVTIKKGIASANGEPLKEDYSWSFTTADVPGGSVLINGGAAYSTSATVNLSYSWNLRAFRYSYSDDPAYFEGSPSFISNVPSQTGFSFTAGGGNEVVRTIYVQFLDLGTTKSSVVSDSIIVDTIAPTAPTAPAISSLATHTPTWTWTSGGGGNGTFRYRLYSFGSSTNIVPLTETTAVSYTSTGIADGSYRLFVAERDNAGNWSGETASSIAAINAPPNSPVVTATSPTLDTTPAWSWTPGGFGNGSYRYQLDSTLGAWTTTTATSYTPAAQADGLHTLYVQESDGAEWSSSGYKSVVVAPYIPYIGQQNVDVTPTFSWREPSATSYTVQISTNGESYSTIATGITSGSYSYSGTLNTNTTYYWRLYYRDGKATIYVTPSTGASFKTSRFGRI